MSTFAGMRCLECHEDKRVLIAAVRMAREDREDRSSLIWATSICSTCLRPMCALLTPPEILRLSAAGVGRPLDNGDLVEFVVKLNAEPTAAEHTYRKAAQ